MGLDIDDILEEKIAGNAKFCQRERLWLCFYTSTGILNKADQTRANKQMKSARAQLPKAGDSQQVLSYFDSIRKTHSATVKAVINSVTVAGLDCTLLSTDSVLRNVIYSIQGPDIAKHWTPDTLAWGEVAEERQRRNEAIASPRLASTPSTGYKRYLRQVTTENNASLEPILPRPLRDQLLPDSIATAGNFVITNNRIYAPVHVVRHAHAPTDFDQLLQTMAGTPFRIVFTLTPDGLSENMINSIMTGAFSWISSTNRQINQARSQLREHEEKNNGTVVGLSIAAVTWAPIEQSIDAETNRFIYNTQAIESRVNKLIASCTDWGSTHAAATTADPTEALLSTIPGLVRSHITSITPAPLVDVLTMIPISRVRTPWDKGAVLYRTKDGTPVSYEQFSSEQAAWVTLVVGPMGTAKSSQMNALNLGFLVQASESSDLPYLRGIDFRYSGKGIVDIIRSGLPDNQRHRARYIRMKNDEKYSTNVFDTPRGSRKPIPSHEYFLRNFLQSIAYSMRGYSNIQGLCSLCVKELYKRYTDEYFNTGAKRYSKGTNIEVDLAVEKYGIYCEDGTTTWWSIVDTLFDLNEVHISGIAQRYAVPTLEDVVSIATSPNVVADYGEHYNGHPVTELFARAIREVIDALPFLRSVTRFDISDSEVIILDLDDMVPSSQSLSEQQKVEGAIVYLVAMQLLTADFFLADDNVQYFNKKYVNYHRDRLKRLATLKKRFFIDERQRIKGVDTAEAQIDQFIVEGRKSYVDVMQGSQRFLDFSKAVQELSTTIIFCGAGSPEAAKQLTDHYELNKTQSDIIKGLNGPIPGLGSPALFLFKTKKQGDQYLHLFNTEGPLMLCAIATEAADRYVRDELYKRCRTTKKAREIFANAFPSGTVKVEMKRRSELMDEGLYVSKTDHILDDMVEELLVSNA